MLQQEDTPRHYRISHNSNHDKNKDDRDTGKQVDEAE
jgi:hypothetical protein